MRISIVFFMVIKCNMGQGTLEIGGQKSWTPVAGGCTGPLLGLIEVLYTNKVGHTHY